MGGVCNSFSSGERNVFEVWLRDELKKLSSHLLDNLIDWLICAPEFFFRCTMI